MSSESSPSRPPRETIYSKAERKLADWLGLKLITNFTETALIAFASRIGEYSVLPKKITNPNILSIGTHIGIEIPWLHRRHPQAQIACFEPSPATYEKLVQNVQQIPGVTTYQIAVSDRDGQAQFHLDPNSPWGDSLVRETLDTTASVPTVKASSLFGEHIDLATIDVEGAEVAVIRDLDSTGNINNADHFVIELHGDLITPEEQLEIYQILQKNSFKFTTGFGVRQAYVPTSLSLLEPFRRSVVVHAWKPKK